MTKNYATTSERHAIILNELNLHDKVHINDLVNITGCGIRTIQLDLNQRLKEPFRIDTDGKGYYWIDIRYQGLFTSHDLKEFARITGISEIFPDFDSKFLRDIIDSRVKNSFLIKPEYKDHLHDDESFKVIINAIEDQQNIFFRYNGKTADVSPYKLVNMYGYWYLCGTNNGVIKTYKYLRMQNIRTNNNEFNYDSKVLDEIETTDTIWISNRENRKNKIVKVRTTPEFTQYFKDNITIPGETSREDQTDGSLVITLEANIGYEILSIVKSWIPGLEIIEPQDFRDELKKQLENYLGKLE